MTTVYPRPVYIYALVDPRTDEVRYIGQTFNPQLRLTRHMQPCFLKRHCYRTAWLKELLTAGMKPIMRLLETVDSETWPEAEKRQIALHRAAGCRLTNLTEGGDGTQGWVPSEETRERIRRANKGRAPTPEQRAKMSAAHMGRKLPPESVAKVAAANRGKHRSPEVRARLRETHLGKPLSSSHRAKVAAHLRAIAADPRLRGHREEKRIAQCRTPEFRAKISAIQKGKPTSAETRAKMAESARRAKQTPEARARASAGQREHWARRRAEQGSTQLCLFSKSLLDGGNS